MEDNHTSRIGKKFHKEIEEVKNKRMESGLDQTRSSTKELTDLIVRHEHWKEIKKEMIKFDFRENE